MGKYQEKKGSPGFKARKDLYKVDKRDRHSGKDWRS